MDSLVVLLLSRKWLFPYGTAQQPTTCFLSFWIHIIQSRKHRRAAWDRESWTHSVSTVINLSPFTSNFKFRFPLKTDCASQFVHVLLYTLFHQKWWFITRKYLPRLSGIADYIKLNMSIHCLAPDAMCVLHIVLPSQHTRHRQQPSTTKPVRNHDASNTSHKP